MIFLTKDDFELYTEDDILDNITDHDDSKLDRAVDVAISMAKDYLNNRYDTDAIFAATGSDRHSSVVSVVCQIAYYLVHKRTRPDAVAQHVEDGYSDSMKWLERVSEQKINPVGLPVPEGEEGDRNKPKDYILVGGETKRENRL